MSSSHDAVTDGSGGRVAGLLAELEGVTEVMTHPEVLASYSHDETGPGMAAVGSPAALVRPRQTAEVQAAVRAASRHGVPIVPRGAGSGLRGGANAVDDCLVICTERMADLLELDPASLFARVQPGLINARLGEAAAEHGLRYAPDPASFEFSTLGGNVATNAGGLCCVKYGVTRDSLLELEVVLADGSAVRVGHRTRKGVAGYDLTALFCGSEGTLGIVTEATLRLMPETPPLATLAASFPSLGSAGAAIARISAATTPAVLELMDRTTVAAVEAMAPQGLDEDVEALVFGCSDAPGGAAVAEVERMAALCEAAGASLAVTTDEVAEGRMLMSARRLAYPALERLGATLLDDVCVPLGKISALLEGVEVIGERAGLKIGTFGHAGDGNMHPTIVYDAADRGEVERARSAFAEIVRLALELGGTVSGEHGVGSLKRAFLGEELGASLSLHHTIKAALDPAGVMNPGKAI
jgi:glycolate oxidase